MSSALLVVGSPKAGASASRAIGEALLTKLADRGWETGEARVPTRDPGGTAVAALVERARSADLVVLAFPVYIDTLPGPVTRLFEEWADAVGEAPQGDRLGAGAPRLAVLTQCGFPEAAHTRPAVTACRLFAERTGLTWAGDVAFGMGGALEGAGLERGPFARFGFRLDDAADALTAGEPIPHAVGEAFASGAMPSAFYLTMAQLGWRLQAYRNKADAPIKTRRYAG